MIGEIVTTRPLLEGPLYFAGSARAERAQRRRATGGERPAPARGPFWCVLASLPVINHRGTLLAPCYAVCGSRLATPQMAFTHAGTPAFLPITIPCCRVCLQRVHGDAMEEIRALAARMRQPAPGSPWGAISADPSHRLGLAYVEACRAQPPRPGTWRIAAGNPWRRAPEARTRLTADGTAARLRPPALPRGRS